MSDTERVQEFKAQIASMGSDEPAPGRERRLLVLSIALMLGGLAVGLLGYAPWRSSVDQTDQLDAIVIAILGLGITIIGAALFVRCSLTQFLRFWLARVLYEQQRDR